MWNNSQASLITIKIKLMLLVSHKNYCSLDTYFEKNIIFTRDKNERKHNY